MVRGEVDDYGIIALRNLLAEHGGHRVGRLVVDLSEVDYLPSVGGRRADQGDRCRAPGRRRDRCWSPAAAASPSAC